MTAQPYTHVRFRRAIERRALWLAEDAAREFPNLVLDEAVRRLHPEAYAAREAAKVERRRERRRANRS